MPVKFKNEFHQRIELPGDEEKRIAVMRGQIAKGGQQVIACKLPNRPEHYYADRVEFLGPCDLWSEFQEDGTVRAVWITTSHAVRLK